LGSQPRPQGACIWERSAKGTRLTWVGRWGNSADNPRNPDPSKEVRWGLQTWDEMMNGWIEVVRERKP
jgi:hypothetical protein